MYGHIDESVLLSFSCSGFALLLFCRSLSLSPYRREPFLRSTSLGQGAVLDRRVFCIRKIFLFSIFRLKLCNQIQNAKFVLKFNFQSVSYV
jgi:hypothetical protein